MTLRNRRRRVVVIIGYPHWADRTHRNRARVRVLAAIQRADLVVTEIFELHGNPITDGLTRQRVKRHLRVLATSTDDADLQFAVVLFGTFAIPPPISGRDVLWLPDPLLDE